MRFKQHVPGFVDGVDPEQGEFATLEELLAMPVVKRWASAPSFQRFSIDNPGEPAYLMAEMQGGAEWWVVGCLSGLKPGDGFGLPKWVHPGKPSALPGG